MDDITDFLYLIGSVFAPMIAVQIADVFILRKDKKLTDFDWRKSGDLADRIRCVPLAHDR